MAAVLALTLSACGGTSGEKSSGSSSSASAGSGSLASIKLTGGDAKTAPTIELATKPFSVGAFETRVVKEGTGEAATEKDVVQVQYNLINGTTGAKIDSNWGTPSGFDLSDTELIAGLRKSLLGAKKGATMLSALPPAEAFGAAGNTQLNIKATDTLVMAYEIVDKFTPLAQAEGTEEKLDPDLPKVTWKAGEAASFEMPKSDPPKKLVIKPLITGTGPKVKEGQTAVVTYTGALWRNGKVFDSSFAHSGKFSFAVGGKQVISGWDKGVVNQPVGSRLLLVVPPDEGYGKEGSGEIKGTDTLVFVVDILSAY